MKDVARELVRIARELTGGAYEKARKELEMRCVGTIKGDAYQEGNCSQGGWQA